MSADFSTIHNHHERSVIDAVNLIAARYPAVAADLWPDVACVALNRLPARYIRHKVDLAFFLTEHEGIENERAIQEAVDYAFQFVQARHLMRARR
jgi:hypothetical protein